MSDDNESCFRRNVVQCVSKKSIDLSKKIHIIWIFYVYVSFDPKSDYQKLLIIVFTILNMFEGHSGIWVQISPENEYQSKAWLENVAYYENYNSIYLATDIIRFTVSSDDDCICNRVKCESIYFWV